MINFNYFVFTPKQLKILKKFDDRGWVFEEEYSTNHHNGNEECDFKYKSPRMKKFKTLYMSYGDQFKGAHQLLEGEAWAFAFDFVNSNEEYILKYYRDKFYKQALDNPALKAEDIKNII